ncbi:DUF262 domain-containing protein [Xanthomonas arboricola]|uniref:DUF262 domain-containing protein n=1 Tax=Xanthomonas arboricola TaxID=56448 RepID=UPI000CEDE28A|nr:DUF262 domain-containing protein [Xanthomonas arboricola]PPT48505.1 hypothetical protein XarjCFBP7652_11195 [Xanthomonas arboricola]
MSRRHNFMTVSWFNDVAQRTLLDLNPSYQRRSVWNQEFKDYFVDTVLLNYPAPAIFLYENIGADGRSIYHVVDGKQRLTTLLEFLSGVFPVSEKSSVVAARGKYFSSLDDELKKLVWSYQFLVEYIPTDDEQVINGIFDRINRNVSKLTPQELRHARLDGDFIKYADQMSDWMAANLPSNFPRFASQSKKQMKDVEFAALLFLLIEEGAKGYSQEALDEAFTSRDQEWEGKQTTVSEFQRNINVIREIISASGDQLVSTRLRNQADFYSLFGAISKVVNSGYKIDPDKAARKLMDFIADVEDETKRSEDPDLTAYYDAARSASNDRGPRARRIELVSDLLKS